VRSAGIVVSPPGLDLDAHAVERHEPVHGQTLLVEAFVERITTRLIRQYTRSGNVQGDVMIVRLATQSLTV